MNMEIIAMPAIELKLGKSPSAYEVNFSGVVEAEGSTGYKFSGTLDVSGSHWTVGGAMSDFVRIGHGGESDAYVHLDRKIEKGVVNIEGRGERAANEKVQFYVAVKEWDSNKFIESPVVTCDLGVVPDEDEDEPVFEAAVAGITGGKIDP